MLPARVELSQRPHTARMDALLTPLECRYLMEAAVPLLHPVFVVDQPTGRLVKSTQRTGRIASIHPLQQDMVMLLINRRLSAAAGIPVENGEMLTFIAYAQGEEYRPHHDWLEPSEGNVGQRQSAGQREATVMVCLNDGYEGGETHFESSGQRFRGQPGDALVLRNLDPSGQPDRTTRHAGLPVTAGIKWMLSKYYRQRAYVC